MRGNKVIFKVRGEIRVSLQVFGGYLRAKICEIFAQGAVLHLGEGQCCTREKESAFAPRRRTCLAPGESPNLALGRKSQSLHAGEAQSVSKIF